MSTIAVKQVKLGNDIDPSKNFLIEVPAVADGTLSIKRANGTNVLHIDSTGKIVSVGDIELSGTDRKIRGDFSDAVQADRVLFQTSTPNSFTSVGVVPSTTGFSSAFTCFSRPDASNASVFQIVSDDNYGLSRLISTQSGSGANRPITIETGGTERVRIGTDGRIALAHTDTSLGIFSINTPTNAPRIYLRGYGTSKGYAIICRAGSDDGPSIQFLNAAGNINGAISHTATTTSYGTSSDYRLKENVAPMADHFQKIQSLKPVTYSWKVDGSAGRGFIAHELQEVFPQAVTGQKDELDEEGNPKYQAMDASFVIADLVACIQELKSEVDSLKAEIAALKGQ